MGRWHGACRAAPALMALVLAGPAFGDEAPLAGRAAWERLVGNTASGTTPDGPFSEYFAPDGTLVLADRDGHAGGRWRLRGEDLCTEVEDEDEECRALELSGAAGAFVDQGGGRYPFTILSGKREGL